MSEDHTFLLQRVQPAMVGLIDGSLSTLAPIFAVVLASHDTRFAFIAGLATSVGAAISMGFSEGLSDTGELTARDALVELGWSLVDAERALADVDSELPIEEQVRHALRAAA